MMLPASLSLLPEVPLCFCRSEPARSTKLSFETFWLMT